MQDFHVSANAAQWLTTVYMLTNGVLIPVSAFLVQKVTTRRLFLLGMGSFAVGTLLAGLAPSFAVLLAARVVQAAGAAIILPLLMNVILAVYPIKQRGSAMGLMGLVITFAPAIGPTLSGWLLTHNSWHVLFFIVLPFAVLDIAVAYRSLADVLPMTNPAIDVWSIVWSSLGFGGLLFGFSDAGTVGWNAPVVSVALVVAVGSLALFVARQLRLSLPMLEFRVFRVRQFSLATVVAILVFMSMFSSMLLLPLYLQDARGFSPLDSGLLVMPGAIAMGIMSPISGRIFDKVGGRWLGVAGSLLLVATMVRFAFLSDSTGYFQLMLFFVFMMLGMSLIMMPVTTSGLNHLPVHFYPHGTAMSNTLQQVAGAVGTALLVTIMTEGARTWVTRHLASITTHGALGIPRLASIYGMDRAFQMAACFAVLCLILCFFVANPRPSAAGSVAEHMGLTGREDVQG